MKIYFNKCNKKDFDDFYILRCDKPNIFWTGYKQSPNKDTLKKWFFNQLNNCNRIMFIIRESNYNNPVGYLYIDIVRNCAYIESSLGVYSKYCGKGIGTKIIKFAIEYTRIELINFHELIGWIFEDNKGSIRTFLKNGFSETDEVKEVFFAPTNSYKKMRKYIYIIK